MERYIGEIKIMENPKFEDIQILWMTNEQWRDPLNKYNPNRNFPSVWFIYEGIMYWALSNHEFNWFEQYSDAVLPSGKAFDEWNPGKEEWEYMLEFGYEYRVFDYEKAILQVEDLDHWCDYEIQFVTEWNRNKKIDDILK